MTCRIAVEWKTAGPQGLVLVRNGVLKALAIVRGKGRVHGSTFLFSPAAAGRLNLVIAAAVIRPGPEATLVTIRTPQAPFSFFLRDVSRDYPILIPEYGVAVTEGGDGRTYAEIERAVLGTGRLTCIQQIESEPEETFERAAAATLNQSGPTWLGLSRDMRIFEIGFREGAKCWDWIHAKVAGFSNALPGDQLKQQYGLNKHFNSRYNFMLGRGIGCTRQITRRLEEGVLPILTGTVINEHIRYDFTGFVTLESRPLTPAMLRGTHFLVADHWCVGNMMMPEQQRACDQLLRAEMNRDEETVCYFHVRITNTAAAPRYAWFKTVFADCLPLDGGQPQVYEPRTGFGRFDTGPRLVYAVSRLNGRPLPQEEMAVLLKPNATAVLEFRIPHRPLSPERARKLAEQDFEQRLAECRRFWQGKLQTAAGVRLPEPRVDEMIRAGLLHLDLIAYGREPRGTVTPTVGKYAAIGSESAPIIQFMDSMGWHGLAERSLQYFLDKQHADGFIQNFGGYMLETGAALWSMGEHYRYTRNDRWVRRIAPKLLKSCEFLIRWRARNKRPGLRGRGYGMLEGKCADPEDPFRAFMLNGYAYLGLQRAAEMLKRLNPRQSARLAQEAAVLKRDIRAAFLAALARSPVVPLGNGAWCPSAPPWVEATGPLNLFVDHGLCFTHGTFTGRDSMLGPLWLVFQEVIDPRERIADWLIQYHCEFMHDRNVALSQPYYSRHDWVHLQRGEIKSFLKYYYNAFAALADRQTYSFWEHFFHASPHKTHEEAWFLMQTRWMLWLEEGDCLKLLSAVPRSWLADGQCIELDKVASYFGPLSLRVESHVEQGRMEAVVNCPTDRGLKAVRLRLPHPAGARAVSVTGGRYDPAAETVTLHPFRGRAKVTLRF